MVTAFGKFTGRGRRTYLDTMPYSSQQNLSPATATQSGIHYSPLRLGGLGWLIEDLSIKYSSNRPRPYHGKNHRYSQLQ